MVSNVSCFFWFVRWLEISQLIFAVCALYVRIGWRGNRLLVIALLHSANFSRRERARTIHYKKRHIILAGGNYSFARSCVDARLTMPTSEPLWRRMRTFSFKWLKLFNIQWIFFTLIHWPSHFPHIFFIFPIQRKSNLIDFTRFNFHNKIQKLIITSSFFHWPLYILYP